MIDPARKSAERELVRAAAKHEHPIPTRFERVVLIIGPILIYVVVFALMFWAAARLFTWLDSRP